MELLDFPDLVAVTFHLRLKNCLIIVLTANGFHRAFVKSFGRTARADTRHPAFFRASCDHACPRADSFFLAGFVSATISHEILFFPLPGMRLF